MESENVTQKKEGPGFKSHDQLTSWDTWISYKTFGLSFLLRINENNDL